MKTTRAYKNLFVYFKIGRLGGGGSDFATFVQHIGVPAAMMSFDNGKTVSSFCKRARTT